MRGLFFDRSINRQESWPFVFFTEERRLHRVRKMRSEVK